MDYKKVGKKLQQLRLEQGLTQEQVAEDLHCTIAFVSNIENNRTKINLRVLMYYANLCNVSIDSILNAGVDQDEATPEDKLVTEQLLKIFNTFDLETRKKIVKSLKVWK